MPTCWTAPRKLLEGSRKQPGPRRATVVQPSRERRTLSTSTTGHGAALETEARAGAVPSGLVALGYGGTTLLPVVQGERVRLPEGLATWFSRAGGARAQGLGRTVTCLHISDILSLPLFRRRTFTVASMMDVPLLPPGRGAGGGQRWPLLREGRGGR